MKALPHVFISSTTKDLKSERRSISELVNQHGYHAEVQEIFAGEPDSVDIPALLDKHLKDCDAMIHICGFYHGGEPKYPADLSNPRSYTQMEYDYAKKRGIPVLVLVADQEMYQASCPSQHPELAKRQMKHYEHLQSHGGLYYIFKDVEDIGALVTSFLKNYVPLTEVAPKPNNLPFPPLGNIFVGRGSFLDQIKTTLHGGNYATAITPAAAVHGLGGQGKTRAAIEYAWREKEHYNALLFISATSSATLETQIAGLCDCLEIPKLRAPEDDPSRRFKAAFEWLASHQKWLLIVDNVDTNEAHDAIHFLLARFTTGHTIITSRLATWQGSVVPLGLPVLTEEAGGDLILQALAGRIGGFKDNDADAKEISRALGGHALALQQAAAYIRVRGITLKKYIETWRIKKEHLLTKSPKLGDYPTELLTTWDTTFDALSSASRSLLKVISFYASAPIPRDTILAIRLPDTDTEDALAELNRWHFVEFADQGDAVIVHALVQAITRHNLNLSTSEQLLAAALEPLIEAATIHNPDDVREWPVITPLVPHWIEVTNHTKKANNSAVTVRLLCQIGKYFNTKAMHVRAEPFFRDALAIAETYADGTSEWAAITLNNLGQLLVETNRLAEAEPMMRRALAINEKNHGPEHPLVAVVLSNLAGLLQATNRPKEAEPLLRRAVSINSASYGDDHPLVAARLINLAALLQATGRQTKAEPMIRRALTIDETVYGTEHPLVATDLNNLAQLLASTNRLEEAEPLMRRALDIDETAYGKDHPKVAVRLNNLAQLLDTTNRSTEAEPMMRKALAISEAAFGKDHPHLAIRLNNLSNLLMNTDRTVEAEPLSKRHLEIFIQFSRSTGHMHPHLKSGVSNYTLLLLDLGMTENDIQLRINRLFNGESVPDLPPPL